MNIEFLGHNCFLVTHNNTALIIDPWFSDQGAFFGSWMQYPINYHLKEVAKNKLKSFKNKYIFITHEHLDHFDLDFLESINFDFNMIIPKYHGTYLRETLSTYNPEELEDNYKKNLNNDLSCSLLISDVGVNHDAAILISDGKESFLNQNDCKIFDRLNSIDVRVDYYSVQFSGANAFPSTYNYSEKVITDISLERSTSKLKNVSQGIKALNPKLFIPAAGPAIFPHLDPSLSMGNGNIFVHQDCLKDYLKINNPSIKIAYMRPGDVLDINNINENPILPPTYKELEFLKTKIVDVWSALPNKLNIADLESAIQKRLDQLDEFELSDLPVIQFVWDEKKDKGISIDLNNRLIQTGFDRGLKKFFRISASEKYFALMSNCKYRWQDISLSMRATIKRRPDIFSSLINVFIFSDVENIRDAFYTSLNIPKDRCVIKDSGGCVHEIDRYCPHQGADLSEAAIDKDGYLICPRHGWRFDLHDGGISNRTNTTINAVTLDD